MKTPNAKRPNPKVQWPFGGVEVSLKNPVILSVAKNPYGAFSGAGGFFAGAQNDKQGALFRRAFGILGVGIFLAFGRLAFGVFPR